MNEALFQSSSLVVYFAAVVFCFITLREVKYSHHPKAIKTLSYSLLALSLSMTLTFIVIQIAWVIHNHSDDITQPEAFGWVVYDWLNGITHLAFILSVRVFLCWKILPACLKDACPGTALAKRLAAHTGESKSELMGISKDLEQLAAKIENVGKMNRRKEDKEREAAEALDFQNHPNS